MNLLSLFILLCTTKKKGMFLVKCLKCWILPIVKTYYKEKECVCVTKEENVDCIEVIDFDSVKLFKSKKYLYFPGTKISIFFPLLSSCALFQLNSIRIQAEFFCFGWHKHLALLFCTFSFPFFFFPFNLPFPASNTMSSLPSLIQIIHIWNTLIGVILFGLLIGTSSKIKVFITNGALIAGYGGFFLFFLKKSEFY